MSTYSRDETVAVITDYYNKLTRLPYVEPDAVRSAPEGGWTSINIEELRKRGKTDEVIELLRHLPYLETSNLGERWSIIDGSECMQYHRGDYDDRWEMEPIAALPGHIIQISTMTDRNCSCLLMDTHTGCIIEFMPLQDNLKPEYYDIYDTLPDSRKWEAFPSTPVRDFFDSHWLRFENLIMMVACDPVEAPYEGHFFSRFERHGEEEQFLQDVSETGRDDGRFTSEFEHHRLVFNIYRNFGWPDAFDREGCKRELGAFIAQGY